MGRAASPGWLLISWIIHFVSHLQVPHLQNRDDGIKPPVRGMGGNICNAQHGTEEAFNKWLLFPKYNFSMSPHSCSFYLSELCICSVAQSRLTLWSYRLQAARLLCPWDFPGKNIGVGCHFLLQEIFPTQGSNWHLLHWQIDSKYLGSPVWTEERQILGLEFHDLN